MDKRSIITIIIVTFVVTIFVILKTMGNNQMVELDMEVSLEAGQMVSIKNDDMTKIKLDSINEMCEDSTKCSVGEKNLSYSLTINGKDYSVTEIPYSMDLRNNYIVDIIDGDEDHLVLKVVQK